MTDGRGKYNRITAAVLLCLWFVLVALTACIRTEKADSEPIPVTDAGSVLTRQYGSSSQGSSGSVQTEAPASVTDTAPSVPVGEPSSSSSSASGTAVSQTQPTYVTWAPATTDGEITTTQINPDELAAFERVLYGLGFKYDPNQNIFFSVSDPWQRNFGFSKIYDFGAVFMNMIYETKRMTFNYGGKDWLFQLWKGRYGITTGFEMGIYNRREGVTSAFYGCADDSEVGLVTMCFTSFKEAEPYFKRGPEQHWWLTGFRLGEIWDSKHLNMIAEYIFNETEMADAFETALVAQCEKDAELQYIRFGDKVDVFWGPMIDRIILEDKWQ